MFGLLIGLMELSERYQLNDWQLLGIIVLFFLFLALLSLLFDLLVLILPTLIGIIIALPILPFIMLYSFLRSYFRGSYQHEETTQEAYTFEDALEKVRELEEERKQKGFKPGWLYHQCKHDPLLLEALEYLRAYGDIPGGKKRSSYQQEHSHNTSGQTDNNTNNESREKTEKAFDPYEILGIARGASKEVIKKSYREQMKLYHPDRVAHLGEALKELANQKAKEIQRAFEMLYV
jgi:DnaJ-domain-containing protein 1